MYLSSDGRDGSLSRAGAGAQLEQQRVPIIAGEHGHEEAHAALGVVASVGRDPIPRQGGDVGRDLLGADARGLGFVQPARAVDAEQIDACLQAHAHLDRGRDRVEALVELCRQRGRDLLGCRR